MTCRIGCISVRCSAFGGKDTIVGYECDGCDSVSNTQSWAGPELLFGWHWTFDSGLNIVWAAGFAKHATDSSNMSSSDSPDANAYFRVGYAF